MGIGGFSICLIPKLNTVGCSVIAIQSTCWPSETKEVTFAGTVTPAYIFRMCDLISSNAPSFCTALLAEVVNEMDVTPRKKS